MQVRQRRALAGEERLEFAGGGAGRRAEQARGDDRPGEAGADLLAVEIDVEAAEGGDVVAERQDDAHPRPDLLAACWRMDKILRSCVLDSGI
jgi:hypothetical protein